ncbi:zinc finger protein 91-like [Ochlerotatus camptorhynchus]|uniref:zinc finger protein 91-like n=1 Tax=Ochlerotatus camptorhynchus TaxID=644619 RepID=UPI0031DDA1ED
MTSDTVQLKLSRGEQSSNTNEELIDPLRELLSRKSSSGLSLKGRSDSKKATDNLSIEASCSKCSHCGKEESSFVTLARHILIHHEPAACDLCGITFPNLYQAQHHKKMKHKKWKLKCSHCSMYTSGRVRLQRHLSKCEKNIVPCEFCGKMYENVENVKRHQRNGCRAYERSKEQNPKNAETALLVESGLCKKICYYCNEEFSSPGHLIHHLQICHELTKCDICGITILGVSAIKNHKIKFHTEPKYECPTCGTKFHRKKDYDVHCLMCERRMYSCKLCGRTYTHFYTAMRHNKHFHPDESSLENLQIVEAQKQVQNNDRQMEVTAEETTKTAEPELHQCILCNDQHVYSECSYWKHVHDVHDGFFLRCSDCGENFRSEKLKIDHTFSNCNARNQTVPADFNALEDEQVPVEVDKEAELPTINLDKSKDLISRSVCDICGKTFSVKGFLLRHKRMKHTKPKYECANCSKKFHCIKLCTSHSKVCDPVQSDFSSSKSSGEIILKDGSDAKVATENCGIEEPSAVTLVRTTLNHQKSGTCDICGITLPSRSQAQHHKLTCPRQAKQRDDSQFGAKEIPLPNDAIPGDSTIVPLLKLEIKVEHTMLQEQEYQVPNDDSGRSFAKTLDVEHLENGIKVKEEYIEEKEEILTEHQSPTKAVECHEVPSDPNESLVRHEVMDVVHSKVVKRKPHSKRKKLSSDCADPRRSKRVNAGK